MNDFKQNDRSGGKMTGGKPGRQRFDGGAGRPQRQMYQATCATCGKPTEVPFRPDGQRLIYCREHFSGGKPAAPSRDFRRPAFRAPAPSQSRPQPPASDPRIDDIQKQLAKIQLKLDQLLLSNVVAQARISPPAPAGAEPKAAKKKPASPKTAKGGKLAKKK